MKIIIRSDAFSNVIVIWMTFVINEKLSDTKISLELLDNEKKVNTKYDIFFYVLFEEIISFFVLKPDILYPKKHEKSRKNLSP
jgi:hypothetical protein